MLSNMYSTDDKIYFDLRSRAEIIRLSMLIGAAIPKDILHDPENTALVCVYGSYSGGKSMVVEAIMKTLLEQYDPNKMLRPKAKKQLFIEKSHSSALTDYCMATGTVEKKNVFMGFDRCSLHYNEDMLGAFRAAALKGSTEKRHFFESLRSLFNSNRADITGQGQVDPSGLVFTSSYRVIGPCSDKPCRNLKSFIAIQIVDDYAPWHKTISVHLTDANNSHAQKFMKDFDKLTTPLTHRKIPEIIKSMRP